MEELGQKEERPLPLHCDNKTIISITNNPIQHDKIKHIEFDKHFINEKFFQGQLSIPFLGHLVDIFTKGISSKFYHDCVLKMIKRNIYAPSCG